MDMVVSVDNSVDQDLAQWSKDGTFRAGGEILDINPSKTEFSDIILHL